MEIVVQDVAEPAAPDVPPLVRETTSVDLTAEQPTFPDPDYGTCTIAELAADLAAEPKPRGRPRGSKNKPKIIDESIAPPQEDAKPVPPKKPRVSSVAKRPRVAPREDVIPQPQTPLQVAASMLEILRLEQAERAYRKSQLYKSWIQ